ncbi:phosphoadenylyl-sulfate reductase [Roseobacter denitrificans]|uniref:Adenosine 5'-phosphosulfate reductase n=1 Tax=Roseobacter denitrificans (strain ATCC 33942 / OCh 114) TaxID=375451 RepID=Q164V6_ROSDO|nr:phosphoadenylyl-sulfate reductase [Roseobacter denitrificans]ABG32487.1 phosophoadenylyl-sulfate reductase [Roseobacter denitrificans OCh 114]AVL51944.1 phosphoadenylyl-sulfate reductase [Roseobacter denitrificans]SFF82471.1 phosphoadenylylsulfate reductase (thioredoxin) [Roseobacter denitrificans OCh 114]
MPLDEAQPVDQSGRRTDELQALVQELNTRLRHHGAVDVLQVALAEITPLSLVSSFGAESVALLHLASMVDRNIPVIFVDTEMLFTQTLVYQQELAERLGLRNLRIVRSGDIAHRDPTGTMHRHDPDGCCALRKTEPLQKALVGSNGWITGRKRYQSGQRAALEHFEIEAQTGRIKVNPLAYWQAGDVADYITENRLPRHPLVAQGYPSIGCAPCTSPVQSGEDARAGRWRNTEKDECGIHFVNGKVVRQGDMK